MYVPCSPRNDDVECIVVICTLLNHSLKATILYQRICLGCHLIPEIIVYFLQVIDLEMADSTEIVPFKDFEYIHVHNTAGLLEASVIIGGNHRRCYG